ncbi:MAG: hypothetical protein KDI88_04235 [Gammaproteobacteria bacterium]|nr:hypothetical protein [Gammaproteobacteria bacterium]
MLTTRMKGFIDPITLGFIVAIVGTATALSLDKPDDASTVASNVAQVQAPIGQTSPDHDG